MAGPGQTVHQFTGNPPRARFYSGELRHPIIERRSTHVLCPSNQSEDYFVGTWYCDVQYNHRFVGSRAKHQLFQTVGITIPGI